MARILVNYIYNKAKDEFKILEPDCVYADQKVAVLETEEQINKPLVVPIQGNMTVVDRERYEINHKKFYLSPVPDGKGEVKEDPNGNEVWLPRDTDISKLRVFNGQLVMVEAKKEEPQKQVKPKANKENKKVESEA